METTLNTTRSSIKLSKALINPLCADVEITNSTSINNTSRLVTWAKNYDGAVYNLKYKEVGTTEFTVIENITENSYLLTNLDQFKLYEIYV